jgi:anaerobic selenocysteine-containing dehydrogenase
MPVETKHTFCRFCHANCAMLADVEDGRVTAVRGDPDDPVFGGYTCIKGRQLAEAHNSPERLRTCMVRGEKGFEPAATQAALDLVASRLRAIIDAHGPHSVAVYAGTYAFQNSAGVGAATAFAQGLGTRNFYTSVTLDQPAKVYTTMRYGYWEGGMHSFDTADVCFMIGNNPIVSHYAPPGSLPPFSPSRRLRDALARGLKLIVADPRESDVAKLADIHLPVLPGEDPAMLAGMLNVILSEGLHDRNFTGAHVDGLDALAEAVSPFTPEIAGARAGVDPQQLVAAARLFAKAQRGVASTGTGPEMAGHGTLTAWLVSALNIVCARFCQEGELSSIPRVFTKVSPRRAQVGAPVRLFGEGFQASRFRGLTHLGTEMPCNVLADEILTPGEGQVRALISIGGNPIVAFPDQDKFARALDSLELLVSVDVRMAQTARRSDVVLAPLMCLEREDISNLSEWWYETPYARYTEATIEPPNDLIDEYAMLWGLAKRLGTGLPLAGGPCPMDTLPGKAAFLDLMTAGCLVTPSQVRADTPDGKAIVYADLHPVVTAPDPDGDARFDLAAGDMPAELRRYSKGGEVVMDYPYRLVSRRTRHRFNSTGGHLSALKAKRTTNPVHMHPDDLAAIGAQSGDILRIEASAGSLLAVAEASAALRPGIVSMAHAWGDADAGIESLRTMGSSTSRLVSETVQFDPITGQSLQSAIPVRITPVEATIMVADLEKETMSA